MGEKNTFLKITDSVKSTATQLGKAYEDIKETYNTIIDDETGHEKNDSLQNLNESIQDLSMHLYAVKESLVYMEQHYAKTLDDLNESMKRIQSVTETLGDRLKNIEETMESDSQKVSSFNVDDIHSSQEQISKGIKAINKQIKSVEKRIDRKNDNKKDNLADEIASLRISQQQTNKEICAMEELMRLLVLNHLIDEVPAETGKSIEKDEQDVTNEKRENNDRLDPAMLAAVTAAIHIERKKENNGWLDQVKALRDVGNIDEARQLCRKMADEGNVDAMSRLADICFQEKEYYTTKYWAEKAAEQGDVNSMLLLGWLYTRGQGGVKVDEPKAAIWFEKAAEAGSVTAMDVMGDIFRHGDGISKNYKKAVEWYTKAAEKGHSGAMTSLGNMYHTGEGVALNYDETVRWYKLAIEANEPNTTAMCNLARMYADGEGVQQDLVRARMLYRQAFGAGDDRAKENLESMGFTKRDLIVIKILYIICEQLGLEYDAVKMHDTFIDDLGADSLDGVELIMAFEEEFDIEITDEEAEKIKDVADIVNLIVKKMGLSLFGMGKPLEVH